MGIYHYASPAVWRLLTAPGHVFPRESGKGKTGAGRILKRGGEGAGAGAGTGAEAAAAPPRHWPQAERGARRRPAAWRGSSVSTTVPRPRSPSLAGILGWAVGKLVLFRNTGLERGEQHLIAGPGRVPPRGERGCPRLDFCRKRKCSLVSASLNCRPSFRLTMPLLNFMGSLSEVNPRRSLRSRKQGCARRVFPSSNRPAGSLKELWAGFYLGRSGIRTLKPCLSLIALSPGRAGEGGKGEISTKSLFYHFL